MDELETTAEALLAPGKGLLAADESFPSIEKRFAEYKLPSTEENRRAYREMLFTTPTLNEFISGIILFDETIHQEIGGALIPAVLERQGIIPGIKVDMGAVPLPGFKGEKITQGLDGLRERLAAYRKLGARFTKWRAVIEMGDGLPTRECITANAGALALFAALSQEAGLVPIVEPEIMMEGPHTISRCEEVTRETLDSVFAALVSHRVELEGMLLKTNMVLPGDQCAEQSSPAEIADATLRCFRRSVPAAAPGIVFLSGGQGDVEATERLNAICATRSPGMKLTFSFGRALQAPALEAWRGLESNVAKAQTALRHRAERNSLAVQGIYSGES